jgi:predicted nucleic acid-binding protein
VPFVLDASITLCWAMQDESNLRADAVKMRALTDRSVVPGIWWYEVRNTLVMNERRGRIAPFESERFLQSIIPLTRVVFPHDSLRTLQLARKHKLSVYDAAYLELAVEGRRIWPRSTRRWRRLLAQKG